MYIEEVFFTRFAFESYEYALILQLGVKHPTINHSINMSLYRATMMVILINAVNVIIFNIILPNGSETY